MVCPLLLLMVSFFADSTMPLSRYERNLDPKQSCQCVPSNLCADNDATVNGEGQLDIRLLDKPCPNYFDVCCDNPLEEINALNKNIVFKGCGYQNPIGVTSRITSDSHNALFGELPWSIIVLLKDYSKTERNIYKCGGSLIHPQVVITAAHCVSKSDRKHFTVRAGEWDTKSRDEPLPHQDQDVQEILIHPHFHDGSLKHDIALLFLAKPILLSDNIGLICLAPPNIQLENAMCIAGGWGRDTFEGKHSSVLKKVDLPLVPREKCVAALRNTRLGAMYNLHRSFKCAGGEKNKDTCKGDGGSPLICPIPGKGDRFFQMGIVSWGIGCGETQTPGVYVNVPLYSTWIDKQLQDRSLDATLYKY